MRKLTVLFFVLFLFLFSSFANADLLTIKVTGTVGSSDIGSVQAGDSMVGYCSYSLDAVDQNPSDYHGEYELVSMEMRIGDYVFSNSTQSPTLEIWVTDECYKARCENAIVAYDGVVLNRAGASITLFDLGNFRINRENDLIPISIPDISFFTDRNSFSAGDCDGVIDSIEVVPEPCSVLLLGLGGVGVLRRRRLG